MCAIRGSPLPSLSAGRDTEEGLWVASSSPPPSQELCRGYPINNFQLHLTLQSQPPSLMPSPEGFPLPQPVLQVGSRYPSGLGRFCSTSGGSRLGYRTEI